MVIDRDRGLENLYTQERITRLLTECSDREKTAAVFGKTDEETTFLKHCLKFLDPEEKDVIEKIYFDGVSVRKYSRMSGFSRNFINRQRDKSVELLTKFFNVKFSATE